ncbi:hypothetical protein GOBAR_DD32496 [Gossypium barbadense]|nr:hypothetical protein GOBAR_DD32496 [Gossypium barbadense]
MMDLRRLALVVVTVAVTVVGHGKNLSALRAHDIRRHGRLLSTIGVDLPLGGNGHPSETGLYFAKIGLGNPSKDYYVQVDTGSDILWVNCAGCDKCPTKSDLGLGLTLYDPKKSSTSSLVYCDQDFCTSTYDGPLPGCKSNLQCQYNVVYGDGSSTAGYFVKDNMKLEQVTGAELTMSRETCSAATAADVYFWAHYNIVMKDIEVGGDLLRLPSDIFDSGDQKGTIVDSGTTLAYLPSSIYEPLMTKILSQQPALNLHTVEDQFTCFQFAGSVDSGFPVVKFHFEDSLVLTVFPHEYTFQIRIWSCWAGFIWVIGIYLLGLGYGYKFRVGMVRILKFQEDIWCFGWQNSGVQSKDGKDMILLGVFPPTASMSLICGIDLLKLTKDLVLSNKLVIYDIENQNIGWTEYNCSSSIKVKDESSGAVYSVGAHDIGSASSLRIGGILTLLSIIIALLHSSIA